MKAPGKATAPGPATAATADALIHRHYGTLFALLLALAVLVRLPGLDESLWYDETWYTFVFLNDANYRKVLFEDIHPLLYPLFMSGWIRLFDDGELAVRLPSMVFGLISLGLSGLLARRWFGRKAALLTLLLLVCSPVHVWYCQEAKNNMLLLLLTQASVWAVWRAWQNDRRADWILAALCAVAALWTHLFALWIVAALCAWMGWEIFRRGWRQTGKGRIRRASAWAAVTVTAWLPFLIPALTRLGGMQKGYLRPFALPELYKLYLVYLSHGYTIRSVSPYAPLKTILQQPWAYFVVDFFYAGLLVTGIGVVLRAMRADGAPPSPPHDRSPDGLTLLMSCFLLPPAALWVASILVPRLYIERSMIIVLPFFLMLLSAGCLCFRHRWLRRTLVVLLAGLNLWGLAAMRGEKAQAWTVYKPNPDWRSAAAHLVSANQAEETRGVILVATPAEALNYYAARFTGASRDQRRQGRVKALPIIVGLRHRSADLRQHLRCMDETNVYLIHNHRWSGGFALLKRFMDQDPAFRLLDEKSFDGLTLYRYRRWFS